MERLVARIAKAPEQTDLNYNITVSQWDAVDTVNVKPGQSEVPVITKIDGNGAYAEKKKRYDVYYTQDGEISFDATCSFAPDIRVKYDEPGQKEWLTVEKSEPELIAGSPNVYKRHFKVTFPKMDTKGIRNAMLLVHNGGSEVECDTIFVRHTIYYPGTDLEGIPVEKNGVTTIWAPVNCGATRLPTEIYLNNGSLTPEQLQSNFEQQGYLYQWGRKVPFKPMNKDQACDFVEFATDNDFPTYEEGTVPGYAGDKFIIGTPTNAFNWFKNSNPSKPDFSPTIQAAGNTWPRQNDPCTNGWRIASKDEGRSL